MRISQIGTSFAGLWGSKKKPKKQEETPRVTAPTQDFFEIQKTVGSWRVSVVSRSSSKAHNLRIEKIDGSCGDYYNVNGFALEHNSQAGHAGGAYGCFLDRDEKELVDDEYYLFGGYSISDIEKIEKRNADGIYETVWLNE